MKALEFEGVGKAYGKVHALLPTDLHVRPGEFLTLLGPSGSGKSTLLNIAAGHIIPDRGRVRVGEQDVTGLPPRKRNMGMVFQSYALFPHMNVFDNVAYGLRARGNGDASVKRRVAEVLELVQLAEHANRKITQLSGGQQQRVALARSLAVEPDVLLLDEPMGALDRQLRKRLQLEIRRLHRKLGRTMVFVTHDQEEALVMSDRVAVFRAGGIEQVGSARELYESPNSEFVASFLGESNLFVGRVVHASDGRATLDSAALGGERSARAAPGLAVGAPGALLIRPESLRMHAPGSGWEGEVTEVVYLGEMQSVRVTGTQGFDMWVRHLGLPHPLAEVGRKVGLSWDADAGLILPRNAGGGER